MAGGAGKRAAEGAALDRLTYLCTILKTGGESYRLRDARRRRRGMAAEAAKEKAGNRQ